MSLRLILTIGLGYLFMYSPVFHNIISGTPIGTVIHDPDTVIWTATAPNNDATEFNLNNFRFRDNFIGTTDTLETIPPLGWESSNGASIGTGVSSHTMCCLTVSNDDLILVVDH